MPILLPLVVDLFKAETEDSKKLAILLSEKVFAPLTNLITSSRAFDSLNPIEVLAYDTFRLPHAPEIEQPLAYKHAMVLGLLDKGMRFGVKNELDCCAQHDRMLSIHPDVAKFN